MALYLFQFLLHSLYCVFGGLRVVHAFLEFGVFSFVDVELIVSILQLLLLNPQLILRVLGLLLFLRTCFFIPSAWFVLNNCLLYGLVQGYTQVFQLVPQ